MTGTATVLASARQAIGETLGALLSDVNRVALIDFPNHSNVGDSAIWLGELAYLRGAGLGRPAYTCDLESYDPDALRRRVGAGMILLHGGGNVGDLWERHQRFREQVLADFPANPVVQLPQSVHFTEPTALSRAQAAFDAHPRFTLLVRERQSLAMASEAFRGRVVLCPDLAVWQRPRRPSAETLQDVLWLLRTDHESCGAVPPNGVTATDWLAEPATPLLGVNRRLRARAGRVGMLGRIARRAYAATFGPLARQRVARGVDLLSSARSVVTDRLHAHLLCLLLGIPHVLLDNSYGKVRSFYDTWTSGSQLVKWAGSSEAALSLSGSSVST